MATLKPTNLTNSGLIQLNKQALRATIAESGTAQDLTNTILFLTVKKSFQDQDNEAIFQKNSGPSGGITFEVETGQALIQLDPVDTADIVPGFAYHYDLKWVTENGADPETVAFGDISWIAAVTRTSTLP